MLEEGSSEASVVMQGITLGEFDASTSAVIKYRDDFIDADFEFEYEEGDTLLCTSDDWPSSFNGDVWLFSHEDDPTKLTIKVSGEAAGEGYFKVISIDQNGAQIYP